MNNTITKTVLIAPLDWGLGHATRCMPIIDVLIQMKHRVVIAGSGDSFLLLQKQYPDLVYYELPGYHIQYPAGSSAAVQTLLQAPGVFKTIKEEHHRLEEICAKEKIDLIISDNRYGVWHKNIYSIFICHQIAIQAPSVFRFMNPVLLQLHLQRIRKFNELWIPDETGSTNLSGKLAHAIDFKIPVSYTGILSRFATFRPTVSFIDKLDFSILIVLSGPEPQRTSLEKTLIAHLKNHPKKILLVQGKTEKCTQTQEGNITLISYLLANDLYAALQKADAIICRSGYSTIMDLAALGKKAIFIPTEGQTEQEYLATLCMEKGYAVNCGNQPLDINNALTQLENIPGFPTYAASLEKLELLLSTSLNQELPN